ncbi:MAG: DNA polymerase I [Deltaproteobacteria bacterium CG_4_8_14_3_um_filter_51_11]|nr:DNA polymerase I [bacterium]OIP37834.1 MAG: DNA polymerase I [Desulfobacteraceae bacterium CG2_30_51_40]PIP45454.1 MAG: DNA polymerase I [Deltaproteobacteria bacterium CG23_combo_of_CG06-09_8_20_14_all_51_20]PIW00699.1 MAG: DNA polymerase I [Deltaproteobacteria bacterium CG17_big_fil_post_rev_8_21_14_2_50_51_6]PIX18082.1 MAG: DNA polymerase I [Deltaproteobacteria bacterium CG_4_8_14_3_um_filter_51_11]PIY24932.1 MAG: DNA polymerase I [Deltaproteobacteria bacterium CG_4_10_14_3_um_filter_51_1
MPQKPMELYLIDGSSYIHRAYHAIRSLSNSRGIPTNATFGFTKMLLKVIKDKKPAFMAVVFDSRGPTFRHDIYPEYKANRPPMPDDLAAQIPYIKKIVEFLNIPSLEKMGYEADDIIGTLARRLGGEGRKVVMITGDKDFRQLVTGDTIIWDTMKDRIIDGEAIEKTYGIKPAAFIDVMALSGDTSDNIPGVPGIGEKTALDLIREFGSLEALLEGLGTVKKKNLALKIAGNMDQLLMSRRLVTIDCNVLLDDERPSLEVGPPMKNELAQLFRELEFKGLWNEFAPEEDSGAFASPCGDRLSIEEWLEVRKEDEPVSVYADTNGLALASYGGKGCYVGLSDSAEDESLVQAERDVRGLLRDRRIKKVGYDLKGQARNLEEKGVFLDGFYFDTMLAAYVTNPGLKDISIGGLAAVYLGERLEGAISGRNSSKDCMPDGSISRAFMSIRLMENLKARLKKDENDSLFFDLEMPLLSVLLDMERAGIGIDEEYFRNLSRDFESRAQRLAADIYEKAGISFNINSPRQLARILFDHLGLPAQGHTTKTKAPATDFLVLKRLSSLHPVPGLVLEYRSVTKLKATFIDALLDSMNPSTGRLHTTFNQAVTATGRLSSSNPNLQNIPSRGEDGALIRRGFIPKKGFCLMSADYNQIELRIFAHYSRDEGLLEAFRRGEDIHRHTASQILKVAPDKVTPQMRRIAKAINFGIIYGMGPRRLAQDLEMELSDAKQYVSAYYERYPGVLRYREEMIRKANSQGYVSTLLNRRRYLPEINNQNGAIRSEAERMAVNTPIQGTAADIIKKAMVAFYEEIRQKDMKTRMLLQVHDELVFEVPEEEREKAASVASEVMCKAASLDVPLTLEIKYGDTWADAH